MDPKKMYHTTITCPVCDQPFAATKLRYGVYRVSDQDSDFALNCEGVNPILYDIWVCPNCGYAAFQENFAEISAKDKKIIATEISSHWQTKDYSGERTLDAALETFKLALYGSQLRKAKSSEIAKTCLRIAWLYRWKADPRETEFLTFAAEYYSDAYQYEDFPLDRLDEPHCLYLIAELYRRAGNVEEAARWFGTFFNNRQARENRSLADMARDQYQLVKNLKQD